ncbi:hypothetical protein PHSY_004186 [Pseudozyma hubeiensis SY62]|uniref:Uncharacterized protein n=1 Tax=Pseudozyma hubeiensis (strain SY62) TaxID=1305764 RepID=R9P589_PSEHS|nr:hypothetical protein PHSY_004186 [Pseudozyma hubeiensis SY62]GAC96603.1 hypothetical protein PHSY_004186 [Pseudozyma hubeiensis SY62]
MWSLEMGLGGEREEVYIVSSKGPVSSKRGGDKRRGKARRKRKLLTVIMFSGLLFGGVRKVSACSGYSLTRPLRRNCAILGQQSAAAVRKSDFLGDDFAKFGSDTRLSICDECIFVPTPKLKSEARISRHSQCLSAVASVDLLVPVYRILIAARGSVQSRRSYATP